MIQSPEALKRLLEDPATWANLLDTTETQWVAAMLARFVTFEEGGGVRFPGTIHVHLDVTSIITGGVPFTQTQMLAALETMDRERLLVFSRQTGVITLRTGYHELINSFIR